MDSHRSPRSRDDFLGVAGPQGSAAEMACIKQAIFLIRYRSRIARQLHPGAASMSDS